jgi:hypothetical protein
VAEDRNRWTQVTAQTAELVVVLTQFDPDNTTRLHRTADLLARAAQPDRTQSRARLRQEGAVLPLLVYATRTAAVCQSPAPLVLATIVVLVYAIITILQRLAEQQRHHLHASTRQQIAGAGNELAAHPDVVAEICGRQAAGQAETPALADAPPVQASTPRSRSEASDQSLGSRQPAAKVYVPPSPPTTRGRAR